KRLAFLEAKMKQLVVQLPVYAWLKQKEQRGLGVPNTAIIIGETGDLANYANPAKVWRRMACAPWEFDGKTKMGATWKGKKKGEALPKEEWTAYGYSPRRRSIAWLIG